MKSKVLHYTFFIIGLCFLTVSLKAQLPQGPPAASLGEQGVTFQGITASSVNPAGLAHQKGWQVMVAAEQPYLLEELQTIYAGASYSRSNSGAFGLSLQRQGLDFYSETLIGLSYARTLTSGLSLGVRFDYLQTQIEDYGSDGIFTFDIGLQWQIFDRVKAGFSTFNPFQIRYSNDAKVPSTFDLGFKYDISDRLAVYGAIHKTLHLPEDYRLGISFALHNRLSFNIGVQTRARTIAGGIDFEVSDGFRIHASAALHNALGVSPGTALIYQQK